MPYVILDAGHAKSTPGKRAPGGVMMEYEFNDYMQKHIKPRLEDHKINVYLDNPEPYGQDLSLANRVSKANAYVKGKSNVLFVSLHANAAGNCTSWMNARGIEVFTSLNASKQSKTAADNLVADIYSAVKAVDSGFKNRGHKQSNFYVIKNTSCPAVLVEYGFYDNKADLNLLQNHRLTMVESTVKAICRYFGITYVPKNSTPSPIPPTSDKLNYPNGTYNRDFKVASPDGTLSVRDARPDNGKLGNKLGELKTGDVIFGGYCLNNWMGVQFNGKQGFVSAEYLTDIKVDLPSLKHPFANGTYKVKGKVTASTLNVRKGRPGNTNYNTVLDKLYNDEVVEVDYCLDGWFSVYDHAASPSTGFVSGEFIELVLA